MRLLLLDTCGENASVALADHGVVVRTQTLPPRAASAQLMGTIREELNALGWPLHRLEGVGVVSGPGSFTGVRVGLAAAKGLCEVGGLRMAAVSRLAVLLDLRGNRVTDLAVLDAGRGEFYVRSGTSELLMGFEELVELAKRGGESRVLVAEHKLLESLAPLQPVWVELSAENSLRLVEERLHAGGDLVEAADANYVRSARTLYAAKAPSRAAESRT